MSDQPNTTTGSERFHDGHERHRDALAASTSAKLKELETVIDAGASYKVQAWDNYKGLRSEMMATANEQMDAAGRMIIEAANRADEELDQDMQIEWDYFEERHTAMLDNIIGRYQLYMDIAGSQRLKVEANAGEVSVDGLISNEEEYLVFVELYEAFIKPMNLSEVMAESASATESYANGMQQGLISQIMGIEGLEVPDGTQELFKKITGGEQLNEKDYAMLRNEMKLWHKNGEKLRRKGKDGSLNMRLSLAKSQRETMSTLMLTALSPQDRYEVLSGMVDTKDYDELILGLVASNYIQVSQGDSLIAMAEQIQGKKMDEARENLYSDDMREVQTLNRERTEAAKEKVTAQFGHFNRAQRLLTVKNGFWGLVAVNFAATFAANVAVTLVSDNPMDVFTNPGVIGGAALTGLGLEMSDGFGGVMPSTPMDWIGKLMEDGDEIADQESLRERQKILQGWGNDPLMTQLYYKNLMSIEAVYQEQVNNNQPNPEITLDKLGLSKEDLPPGLRGRTDEEINSRLTEINKTFREDLSYVRWEDQREVLEDAHSNQRYGNHCLGSIDLNEIQ